MLQLINQAINARSTTAMHVLGSKFQDEAGNEYIYAKGCASNAAGKFVKYDENFLCALLAADMVGPVGISMSAFVANEYGWVQIAGVNTQASTDTIAADVALYIDGTAGRADDAVVTGDLILGATSETADTANVATVHLNYPFVTNILG
jgi:hypothetical protein